MWARTIPSIPAWILFNRKDSSMDTVPVCRLFLWLFSIPIVKPILARTTSKFCKFGGLVVQPWNDRLKDRLNAEKSIFSMSVLMISSEESKSTHRKSNFWQCYPLFTQILKLNNCTKVLHRDLLSSIGHKLAAGVLTGLNNVKFQ